MTDISTIHDNLVTLISGELPSYTQLPNPYDPEEAANMFVIQGFGVGFADAINSERLLTCKLSINRNFIVPLINQVTTTDHNTTGRNSITKSIFEDQFKVIKKLEKDPTLSGVADIARYVGDSGILFLEAERAKYYLLEMNIEVEYFEDLT